MNIAIESEDEQKMSFLLEGANVGFANMLRRFAMSYVPTFAIDKVIFYENSSSLFDEYIAHRIGMVPLKWAAGYKPDEEVIFTLEASGPADVTTAYLKSNSEKVKVASERIPLLKLMSEQNLRLEAKALQGIGRKHAKWQAGLVSYGIIDENKLGFKVESFMQMSPREMLGRAVELLEKKCQELDEDLAGLEKSANKKKGKE